MADVFSFDVVSNVNMQFVSEGVQTALKEIVNRFDFKDTRSTVEFKEKESLIVLNSSDEFKLKAIFDILTMRLAKRGVPLKNLDPQKVENSLGGRARQDVKITQGISKDKAREIVAEVKKSGLKVQAAVQGDQLRISSRSKDMLQQAMSLLKGKEFGLDLQFTNYR
ncbi:MAG: YajQ family cyclic di-GMP-binding protein [Elusimicrobiota bacterium]